MNSERSRQPFYLECRSREEHESHRLERLPCTVGRSDECDIRLARERISRRHARLEACRDGLMITDLSSTNGTFVNLQRVRRPTLVRSGDSIHFADHEFRLIHADAGGQTISPRRHASQAPAGHTMAGFTAEPAGFPVQAPQFYELLNDELIEPRVRPVITADNRRLGLVLEAASSHPDLTADYAGLLELAEDMGEESRFNAMVRRIGLQAIEASREIDPTVFVGIQPGEVEDIEILAEELEQLTREHRRLLLAFTLPPVGVAREGLERLASTIDRLEAELALSRIDPADSRQLALCREMADHAFIDSAHGPEALAGAIKDIGHSARVIIERIDDRKTLETFRTFTDVALCGRAVGKAAAV